MSVPTSYDAASLAAAMHAWLGETALSLGWSVEGGSYTDAITDTLLWYGVTDLANATNIGKVRAIARVAVWEAAASAAVSRVDWSRGAERVSGSQEPEAIAKVAARMRAEAVAGGYIESNVGRLRTVQIVRGNDIYGTAERTGGEFG